MTAVYQVHRINFFANKFAPTGFGQYINPVGAAEGCDRPELREQQGLCQHVGSKSQPEMPDHSFKLSTQLRQLDTGGGVALHGHGRLIGAGANAGNAAVDLFGD